MGVFDADEEAPVQFYMTVFPEKSRISAAIQDNGGQVVRSWRSDAITLASDAAAPGEKPKFTKKCYSYKYVDDCIAEGRMLPLDTYALNPPSTNAPAPTTSAPAPPVSKKATPPPAEKSVSPPPSSGGEETADNENDLKEVAQPPQTQAAPAPAVAEQPKAPVAAPAKQSKPYSGRARASAAQSATSSDEAPVAQRRSGRPKRTRAPSVDPESDADYRPAPLPSRSPAKQAPVSPAKQSPAKAPARKRFAPDFDEEALFSNGGFQPQRRAVSSFADTFQPRPDASLVEAGRLISSLERDTRAPHPLVVHALYTFSGNAAMAYDFLMGRNLEELQQYKWSAREDAALLSDDPEAINQVRLRRGGDRTAARLRFLE